MNGKVGIPEGIKDFFTWASSTPDEEHGYLEHIFVGCVFFIIVIATCAGCLLGAFYLAFELSM